MSITCGIDWAEAHHDIAIIDDAGRVLARRRIDTGLPVHRADGSARRAHRRPGRGAGRD